MNKTKMCSGCSHNWAMLTLRLTDRNDYEVREDGQPIGWLWHVTVTLPGPPYR